MLDGIARRLGGVAEPTGSTRGPGEQAPGHGETRLVSRSFEDRGRRLDFLLDRVGAPSLGARPQTNEQADERRARRVGGGDAGPADRLLEHDRCLLEAARQEKRLAVLGQESESLGVLGGQEPGRTSQEVRGGRHVAACKRAPAGRGQPARPVLPDRAAAVVERAELGEIRPRLLEVVAEDLLELDPTVAVELVGPDDEALVESRPARA